MNPKIKNWVLVFVWAGFIFFLSHQPDLKSNLPGELDFILRKLAHISEYAILTFLLMQALQEHQLTSRQVLILAVGLALLYAVSDEYHQSFVFGRESALRDVLIDAFGIFFMAWLNKIKMVK